MADPFKSLYDDIARRKGEAQSPLTYEGGNGRVDRAVDLILNEDFPRSGVLIDVGGATGNLGYALRDHFSDRYVVDIVEDCRGPAEAKGNKFIQANVDEVGLPFRSEPFADLIVALDFIEHILNPEKFARECQRMLKPGGKVLINTPNIQYWRHLHSLVVEGKFPHTSGDREVYHGGHTAFYNVRDMVQIFSFMNGFIEPRMHTRGLTADPPAPIWTTLMQKQLPDYPVATQLSYADLIFSARKL